MAVRQFVDSVGVKWEVFEVRRHIDRAKTVSSGLEEGWLTFVADGNKRRLPDYPAEWWSSNDSALELLCRRARAAATLPATGPAAAADTIVAARPDASHAAAQVAAPRIAPRPVPMGALDGLSPSASEEVVRDLARTTRAARIPAVDAMMRLRRLLADDGIESGTTAFRAARRIFVNTFYFG